MFVSQWGVPIASYSQPECESERLAQAPDFERRSQMPLANIKVIEGVFTDSEKRQIIEKVTDTLVAIEGERLRDKTVVIVEETKSGDWGIGGRTLTTADVTDLRAGG
jgi:4-oxalocrotonate tautomerase